MFRKATDDYKNSLRNVYCIIVAGCHYYAYSYAYI